MKAILHVRYGSPHLLRLEEVAKPAPSDRDVLIKVNATTVSTGDCCIMGLKEVARSLWTSFLGGKKMRGGVAMNNRERMALIAELAATGGLRPVIDRSYPLEQISQAFEHVERGHKKGNVVITVGHP